MIYACAILIAAIAVSVMANTPVADTFWFFSPPVTTPRPTTVMPTTTSLRQQQSVPVVSSNAHVATPCPTTKGPVTTPYPTAKAPVPTPSQTTTPDPSPSMPEPAEITPVPAEATAAPTQGAAPPTERFQLQLRLPHLQLLLLCHRLGEVRHQLRARLRRNLPPLQLQYPSLLRRLRVL